MEDGPNSEGEMFIRSARLSDKFVKPYPNVQASIAANGGAYPPDMSVLAKARSGGADYIYSLLLGYEEAPAGFELDDGVIETVGVAFCVKLLLVVVAAAEDNFCSVVDITGRCLPDFQTDQK